MTTDQAPTVDPRPAELTKKESLVILFTGHGKGKTSAAIGTAVRAHGTGMSACVIQFIKSGEWKSGEQETCNSLSIEFKTLGEGFTWDSTNLDNDKSTARAAWATAASAIESGRYDVVVLDEITYLCSWGWLPVSEVVKTITARPSHVNVVLTGRDAVPELIAISDTASRIDSIHHAYDQGIAALRGIDF